MGLRETLNRNPAIVTGGTLAIIVIAVGFIIYSTLGSSAPKAPTKAYYTVDDGATYFSDDAGKLAPFDYEGKQAVKARVFKCADGKPFVAFLERYTPDAKKKLEEARASAAASSGQQPARSPMDVQAIAMAAQMGLEVKKPGGDGQWFKIMDIQNSPKITRPACPDGKSDGLEPVNP